MIKEGCPSFFVILSECVVYKTYLQIAVDPNEQLSGDSHSI